MKKEHEGKNCFRRLLLLSVLCVAQAARGETAFDTIWLTGPVKLKVLWVVAAVGLIFIISRKQKRVRNRL